VSLLIVELESFDLDEFSKRQVDHAARTHALNEGSINLENGYLNEILFGWLKPQRPRLA
jgi:hypothetical protein